LGKQQTKESKSNASGRERNIHTVDSKKMGVEGMHLSKIDVIFSQAQRKKAFLVLEGFIREN